MNSSLPETNYRVRIGHLEVVVTGTSNAEAIDKARRQLIDDLPRFYDVIRSMDETRFEVRPAA